MYTEETGRGHLDGICVDPNERGGGLGKALFCNLCEYLKNHGSTYMTFFTGLDNPARYIYLFAGFIVLQADWIHLCPVFFYLRYRLYQAEDGSYVLSRLNAE